MTSSFESGRMGSILTLQERLLSVLACRVNYVAIGWDKNLTPTLEGLDPMMVRVLCELECQCFTIDVSDVHLLEYLILFISFIWGHFAVDINLNLSASLQTILLI
ncbi:unnamed protein product [Schistosoma mattheei]|uniref:Uncharacterized protein n=1 Tax=Schistosoma mattheei TaxID=31246 RepID=A0A183NFF2_9TREM|nr:unnamed protein product [Schistosoma mattheei]